MLVILIQFNQKLLLFEKVLMERWVLKSAKTYFMSLALPEKCPYSEFFCSLFSRIRTEYGEIQSK